MTDDATTGRLYRGGFAWTPFPWETEPVACAICGTPLHHAKADGYPAEGIDVGIWYDLALHVDDIPPDEWNPHWVLCGWECVGRLAALAGPHEADLLAGHPEPPAATYSRPAPDNRTDDYWAIRHEEPATHPTAEDQP